MGGLGDFALNELQQAAAAADEFGVGKDTADVKEHVGSLQMVDPLQAIGRELEWGQLLREFGGHRTKLYLDR